MKLENYIANVPNFPKEGIQFKDITTLLQNKDAFKECIDRLCNFGKEVGANVVMGPDARGFIFGSAVAYALNTSFVPVRKPGKLPRDTISCEYALEYGTNTLEINKDAFKKGDKVLIVDDLMATGGTIVASINLAEKLGAEVVGVASVIELTELKGTEKIGNIPFLSLVKYDI
ncbi:adenine phosphoribosyltransferase [bacterium]|nr:adenine phosphoribosyltransferase [bacterium]